ncbi:hypothetical protein [Anaerofustis stercorihominis]|uniref:hypothetical protein n=1 Tax=Anaerofustis stercorihominis TaxID=214853 RepID=UPI00214AB658|nr:hypothetical protein [Anaerofustis stercorihominis]MCR2033714.1 hypothetical protein [Anaerofustis stercorihominis]
MINYIDVITKDISDIIRAEYPSAYIIDKELSDTPPCFPTIIIKQIDNSVVGKYSTFEQIENVVTESYRVDVYSNNDEINLKIIDLVNNYLSKKGYIRNLNILVPNMEDLSIDKRTAGWINNSVV